jgi:hypothetical protein
MQNSYENHVLTQPDPYPATVSPLSSEPKRPRSRLRTGAMLALVSRKQRRLGNAICQL